MDTFKQLAATRRSIRKYEPTEIPQEDIEDILQTAMVAPSGCNSQCWRFVVIRDKDVLKELEMIVVHKVEALFRDYPQELPPQYPASKRKMVSFFSAAPVVIAVFMTHLEYYDPIMLSALKAQGHTDKSIMELFAHPDLLSIGAAVQNLLLAVHEKGYGACWMNEPAIASEEIRVLLGEPETSRFISLVPIGIPAYTPREKKLKELDEVYRVV